MGRPPKRRRESRRKKPASIEFESSEKMAAERKDLPSAFPSPFFRGEKFLEAEREYKRHQAEKKKEKK